jgi:AcrR family transcriptional regulator
MATTATRPVRRIGRGANASQRRAPGAAAARATAKRAPRDGAAADSRARLLAAGLALARRDGLRALSVRGVAAQAGANLGSFVYHFGTREAFVAELIETWYAPFLARLQAAAAAEGEPLARLRQLVLQLVDFMGEHRVFVGQVLVDAAAGEKPARAFMQSLSKRHPRLLLAAIRDAQAAGSLRREDPVNVLLFLLGGLVLPMLFITGLARAGILPYELGPRLQAQAADRAALLARFEWALRGLAP